MLPNSLRLLLVLSVAAGSVLLISAPGPTVSVHDKAYYANPNLVSFVRPGLVIKITGADIATDGAIRARFRLSDPKNLPLDRDGVTTPGSISVSFIAAFIPKGKTQYEAYTTRSATSPITGDTAIQAGTDSGGKFEKTGDGEYTYTFNTRAPQGFDKTVTHSIGAYGSRNLSEFDLGTQYSNDVYNFVPDGSKVTVVRDVVRTASCNKCHDQIAFHGGSRRSVELCVLCHTPQSTDPDTGNTVDMAVFIHKIHAGSSLPSVKAGGKYQIIGHNQSVADYSEVAFPADVRNCAACHASGAAQADNLYKPNRAACGSCHDNVDFNTGENHVDLPQWSDSQCANCHPKQGELEFDASILGAHTIPRFSKMLKGVVLDLVSVDGAAPGKSPTVTFTVKDKSGAPLPLSQLTRLNLVLAGPNTDYATYVSESALTASGSSGRYTWTFKASIPPDAKGSYTIGIEGRSEVKLLEGTKKEVSVRDSAANKTLAFSVDGSPVQKRRTVVSVANCNQCHGSLAMHGDNRNAIEQCVLCHNPNTTAGTTTVDFKVMVHRIHTGRDLARPYVIGNTSFNEVGYPGDRRNCGACHVSGSEQLPLADGLLPVKDASSPINPMPPATAACTGCHARTAAAAHALASTTSKGESCAVCHGQSSEMSVNRVHAR